MRRSNKLLGLALAATLLAGCGLIRQDEDATAPVATGPAATTKPGAKPAKPGAKPVLQKPADKGDPQKRFDEALALLKSNQIAEAEQAFGWIVQDFPEFAGPWTNLGIIYAKSNRNPLAMTAFNKAVSLNRDDATAWNWLGVLYRGINDYARSEQAYLAALKANSSFGLAHLNLAILYDVYLKRQADALEQYKEYQRLGGKDDLRVMAWIAEIENPNPHQNPTKGAESKP